MGRQWGARATLWSEEVPHVNPGSSLPVSHECCCDTRHRFFHVVVPGRGAHSLRGHASLRDFVLISGVDSESQGPPLVVEVVQNALSDDTTPDVDVVRDINWGEGNGFRSWPDGDQVPTPMTTWGPSP